MAGMGKQVTGDGLSANLAGMSKNQLYDIMSQMKTLIEQNQQQARQILIQNPLLTKALFQAQIMLGMVQPPQAIPNIQPPPSQHAQQSIQLTQQLNIQATHALSGQVGMKDQTGASQVGMKDQTGASQIRTPAWMQHQNQPVMTTPPAIPGGNIQSQPMPLHPLQTPQQPKGHLDHQVTPTSLPQSSQLLNVPTLPLHSSSQPPSLHQPQIPTSSNQLQPSLPTTGIPHMPLQPPLLPQPRLPLVGNFQHQYPPQLATNISFQHAGAPQHLPQPAYHPGTRPPNLGPSYPRAQLPLPSQPPPQSVYQAGTEFNNQVGSNMQVDRGSSWMSASPENPSLTQLSAPPPPLLPGQMGPGNQSARPPSLTPEMEKALLQQVMSLTPEQINLLPPEQRNQVLQLQQILRQ